MDRGTRQRPTVPEIPPLYVPTQAIAMDRAAAVKIQCEFLAADGRQVEGKRRIDVHDGCGAAAIAQGGSSGQRLPM